MKLIKELCSNHLLHGFLVDLLLNGLPDYNQLMFKLKTMYPDIILCE